MKHKKQKIRFQNEYKKLKKLNVVTQNALTSLSVLFIIFILVIIFLTSKEKREIQEQYYSRIMEMENQLKNLEKSYEERITLYSDSIKLLNSELTKKISNSMNIMEEKLLLQVKSEADNLMDQYLKKLDQDLQTDIRTGPDLIFGNNRNY